MANKQNYPEISESVRFPILTPRGRNLLHQMRQHPFAPDWNWANGEQLNESGLIRVKEFSQKLTSSRSSENLNGRPDWLNVFVAKCCTEVPFYRNRTNGEMQFDEVPTCSRADLAPRVWEFVPDSEPLDDLIVFSSSGTTGYPTQTPHHPFSAACGVPLLEYALELSGAPPLLRGPDRVAILNLVAYPGAYTTAIVVAYLEEAGCIRINLDPSAWRDPQHIAGFIEQWKSPIWLGDPVAFRAMEKIDTLTPPNAILSSIMHMHDGFAEHLSDRYQCPVIDLYAMTEAGIIAMKTERGHRVLPHDLYIEILDTEGIPCPEGTRGEITLTGGRNPFLPLLRYRTGDFASLKSVGDVNYLIGLHGRTPIEYRSSTGHPIHSMEVMRVLRRYPVIHYEVKQLTNSQYQLEYQGDIDHVALESELRSLFGNNIALWRNEH